MGCTVGAESASYDYLVVAECSVMFTCTEMIGVKAEVDIASTTVSGLVVTTTVATVAMTTATVADTETTIAIVVVGMIMTAVATTEIEVTLLCTVCNALRQHTVLKQSKWCVFY